jgi:hypothetical protein
MIDPQGPIWGVPDRWASFLITYKRDKLKCHNLSFGLATKAKGVARLRAKRKEAWESRQRHCKSAGQGEARELKQEEARESHHILPRVQESARECEGVNTHTPKATPTLGDGVLMDSPNFRERLQGSNLNVLWHSLYHWKAFEV